MNPNLPSIPAPGSIEQSLYPPNSRYHGLPILRLPEGDARETAYLSRRFLPPAERHVEIRMHRVIEGERLDNIAAHYLGDPEMFWRLCDANGVKRPSELTELAGRLIRITLPDGYMGHSHA